MPARRRRRPTREHAAAREIGATLERLGLEADCGADRGRERRCGVPRRARGRRRMRRAPGRGPGELPGPPVRSPGGMPRSMRTRRSVWPSRRAGAPHLPAPAWRSAAMSSLVAALADSGPRRKRRWQLLLTDLVEAIVADAIEASALDFPTDHEFWGAFTRIQDRDIAHALSSLGYRFDGLGGWMEDANHRSATCRWPSATPGSTRCGSATGRRRKATAELFRDVRVAADEYLAGIAGDLTLAEMVAMLGRRADGLAEVWNHWGRIRPLLLDET